MLHDDILDPLGRRPGQPLDPTRHTEADLEMRSLANPRLFAALWQQSPRVLGGNMIKPEDWFNILKPQDVPENRFMKWVRFWDIAFTEKQLKGNDPSFTAGAKVGLWRTERGKTHFIIANIVRWQASWSVCKKNIIDVARRDGTSVKIGVEGGGPQKIAFDDLKDDRRMKKFILKRLTPESDKVARAQPWIDLAEVGDFYIVEGPWRAAFYRECEGFPSSSTHSDQVDAVSGAYEMIKPLLTRKTFGIVKQTGLWRR